MEIAATGKILVSASFENHEDWFRLADGAITNEQARRLEVSDAQVDTDTMILSMPRRLILELGLRPLGSRKARTRAGLTTLQIWGTVRLTIQGRDCISDVIEMPDDSPVLIGRVPLALLDFVVDHVGQRLIGNPEHGGEDIIELY
jgi:hypothetical protein